MVSIEKLKNLRAKNGWSQEQLATISGVSSRTIQRIEKHGDCSLETKMALSAAFGIEPSILNAQTDNIKVQLSYKSNILGWLTFFFIIIGIMLVSGGGEIKERLHINSIVMFGFFIAMTLRTHGIRRLMTCLRISFGLNRSTSKINIREVIRDFNEQIYIVYASAIFAFIFHWLRMGTLHFTSEASLGFSELMFASAVSALVYSIFVAEFIFRSAKMRMESKLMAHYVNE